MEEATMEAPADGTTEQSDSEVEVTETAPVGDAPEGTTEESDSTGDHEEKTAERSADDVDREWKAQYTRKTQESAAEKRLISTENTNLKTKVDNLERMLTESLSDPAKGNLYRETLGIQKQGMDLSEVKNMDDMAQFLSHRDNAMRESILAEVDKSSTQKVTTASQNARWETAKISFKDNPVFTGLDEDGMINTVIETVKSVHSKFDGSNEVEVYQAALDYLKTKFEPSIQAEKDKILDSKMKRKRASTVTPQKTVSTTSQKIGRSDAQTLNAIREKLSAKGL